MKAIIWLGWALFFFCLWMAASCRSKVVDVFETAKATTIQERVSCSHSCMRMQCTHVGKTTSCGMRPSTCSGSQEALVTHIPTLWHYDDEPGRVLHGEETRIVERLESCH